MRKTIAVIGAILLSVMFLTGCNNKNEEVNVSETESRTARKTESKTEVGFSAYDYYNDSSEKIISIDSAESYKGTITASEAVADAEERGFDQRELTYCFNISGDYVGESEASDDSDEKAPLYQTLYVTGNGDVWTVYFIGDNVYACPVSYLYEARLDHEIIFSESDMLVSYVDSENKFYTTEPKESVVKFVVVDKIDAETLEKYTAEEMEKL